MMKRTMRALSLALVALMLVSAAAFAAPMLRMATTTSTEDTGLLDYMEPFFRQATGIGECGRISSALQSCRSPFPVLDRTTGHRGIDRR